MMRLKSLFFTNSMYKSSVYQIMLTALFDDQPMVTCIQISDTKINILNCYMALYRVDNFKSSKVVLLKSESTFYITKTLLG